jgi:hypothetical protein
MVESPEHPYTRFMRKWAEGCQTWLPVWMVAHAADVPSAFSHRPRKPARKTLEAEMKRADRVAAGQAKRHAPSAVQVVGECAAGRFAEHPRCRRAHFASAAACLIGLLAAAMVSADVVVGAFSNNTLDGWEERSFKGHTRYTLVERDSRTVLHASCSGTASVLFREHQVDLTRTPVLQWTWRVDRVFEGLDERTRAGDDYPARVYVVVGGGLLAWRTIAVNYVWASREPPEAAWPNAFTSNAKMLAIRSGDADSGRWHKESRNVREDFRRLHGRDVEVIDGVAVMTDCDNTGGQAEAWYGDIEFVSP